jgi:putative Mn2+ efflux pump MntP
MIGLVTFGICVGGVFAGKKFGDKLKGKAGILGGVILIAIGLKLLIEFLIERFA